MKDSSRPVIHFRNLAEAFARKMELFLLPDSLQLAIFFTDIH